MREMRSILLTGLSLALSAMVIGNAYFQKKQFYPSVVYITKSNPSLAVLYLQAFVLVILMGKLFRKIFFGQLRAAEMEHLIERSWYAVTETCLAFTVFRDDFSPRFVALFTLLLFLKCFHWLAEDRVDYMERSPVISWLFHLRVSSLMSFLAAVDVYFVNHAYYSTLMKGASVQLVFGFEYAVLLTIVLMTVVKYVLHSIDLQNENPWENKAVYLLYTELVLGFIKVVLYMAFMIIMIKVHTFPLFAIRPMYLSLRAFKKALNDVIMSRRAIRNMNTLYPDATEEELQAGDNVCIICREDMVEACKKLPCNHIFHSSCLRSWFQRQQTCPTCRMDVLRMPRPQQTPPPAPPQAPPQPPQFPNMFQGFPQMPGWPPQVPLGVPPQVPPAQPQPQPGPSGTQPGSSTQPTTSAAPSSTASSQPTAAPSPGTVPAPGSTQLPPFMPMFPMYMQNNFPLPPADMSGLSVEELLAMEGTERENVEARLQWLLDIQSLLDGAMLLIHQYNLVAANSNISGIYTTAGAPQYAPYQPGEQSQYAPTQPGEQSQYAPTQPGEQSQFAPTQPTVSLSSPPRTGQGARPKYSRPSTATTSSTVASHTLSAAKLSSGEDSESENIDLARMEGAMGYTPPTQAGVEEIIPEWQNPQLEEHADGMDEVRRRRLEKFSLSTSPKSNSTEGSEND